MKWKENSTQFERPPSGSHIARCYALIDLGTQVHPGFQGGDPRHSRDVRLSFELPMEKMIGTYDEKLKGKPFAVHITCKQSLHPKASLRKYLEGWRGKKFDNETLEKFDPKKLIGLPCRVTLVENGDFTNIDSISPLGKNEKCPKQVNPSVFFSLEPDEFDKEVFAKLSEKTREKISKSPEFKALGESGGEEPQESPPEEGQEEPQDPTW